MAQPPLSALGNLGSTDLIRAGEGDLGVRRPLRQRGGVGVGPERLGQRPESHGETLLRRPGHVDQTPECELDVDISLTGLVNFVFTI